MTSMQERQPDIGSLLGAVSYTLIGQEKWDQLEKQAELLLQTAEDEEQAADIEGMIASQLIALGHADRAAAKLEALTAKHPGRAGDFVPMLSSDVCEPWPRK